jgi:hypothetical protein
MVHRQYLRYRFLQSRTVFSVNLVVWQSSDCHIFGESIAVLQFERHPSAVVYLLAFYSFPNPAMRLLLEILATY